MEFTAQLPVIGLDLAKSVFQLHIVDMDSGEIQRRQIKRAKLTDFFAKCQNAYFSPSWTVFQADRGRDFSVIVDGISN